MRLYLNVLTFDIALRFLASFLFSHLRLPHFARPNIRYGNSNVLIFFSLFQGTHRENVGPLLRQMSLGYCSNLYGICIYLIFFFLSAFSEERWGKCVRRAERDVGQIGRENERDVQCNKRGDLLRRAGLRQPSRVHFHLHRKPNENISLLTVSPHLFLHERPVE